MIKQRQINRGKICKYPGCTFKARAKGYCINHYKYIKEEKNVNDR